jgi:translation initiation factor IF-2
MTLPVHDINYVMASHRKYQFITILFTVVTLAATLGAAFSGIQLSNLKQETIDSEKVAEEAAPPPKTPATADDSAMKEIEALKSELAMEKSSSLKLKAKIKNLSDQLLALKKAAVASRTPKPKAAPATQPKPVTPILPPQKKEPVTVAPPAPPQPQPHQKVAPQTAPASPSKMPANEAVTPSVDSADKPLPASEPKPSLPAPEPEQPSTVPPVAAPPSQPQSTDDNPATTGAGEPDSELNQ